MGKRESKRKEAPNFNSRLQTIREEIKGKSGSNVKRLHDVIGVLRLKHLQKVALWAGGEASSPSFGAYFGYQLASSREALGTRTNDSSIISCGRCEALLQPGLNCMVRIENNVSKGHRRCNKSLLLQNNSVYICQFCSHKNIKPGCVKGYLKTLATSKLICKRGSGTKIVNKASATDAILPTISQSDLQKVAYVSREEMLLLSKRGSDSLRANNLGSNPESDMDATGPTVPVQFCIPVTLLAKQKQESASASMKESRSHLLRHSADLVLEADWLKKDDALQETPLQESAKAPLGRIIGGTSTRKRKKEKASGDASSVQPEGSTSLLGQFNTYSVSSRRRRKSSWSSLKDLTHEEQSKRERYSDLSGIPVPFSL